MKRRPNEKIIADLQRHFGDQLHKTIVDQLDTCSRSGMDDGDCIGVALSVLLFETTMAGIGIGMDEKTFLNMCKLAYRRITVAVDMGERPSVQ